MTAESAADSRRLIVYLYGYPASGKTTTAARLVEELRKGGRSARHVTKQMLIGSDPGTIRLLPFMAARLATTVRVARVFIRSGPVPWYRGLMRRVALVMRYIFREERIVRGMTGIVVIDEPVVHQLWSKAIPAREEVTGAEAGISSLLCPIDESVSLLIDLDVPAETCIARARLREHPLSRFEKSSEESFLDLLRSDTLYPAIRRCLAGLDAGKAIMRAGQLTPAELAPLIARKYDSLTLAGPARR